EPARGRKPVLRDELAAVVVKQQYPPERLHVLCNVKASPQNNLFVFRSATVPDARRDNEKYRQYSKESQRRRRGRPARKMDKLFCGEA
ncbi:MAG: hypothetical protein JXA30_02975, partial [Deltaproteobacteria bacterium]|nr:hypothetical protein [Deltaproteobacteria bacterium]